MAPPDCSPAPRFPARPRFRLHEFESSRANPPREFQFAFVALVRRCRALEKSGAPFASVPAIAPGHYPTHRDRWTRQNHRRATIAGFLDARSSVRYEGPPAVQAAKAGRDRYQRRRPVPGRHKNQCGNYCARPILAQLFRIAETHCEASEPKHARNCGWHLGFLMRKPESEYNSH